MPHSICAYTCIYTRYKTIQKYWFIDCSFTDRHLWIYMPYFMSPQGESLWQIARITMEERFVIYIVYMTLSLPVGYNNDQDDIKSSIIAKVVINDRVFLQCFFSFAFWSLVSVDVDLLITCASIFILFVFHAVDFYLIFKKNNYCWFWLW